MEQGRVKGESMNEDIAAELSAELETERNKNEELVKKVSELEAQVKELQRGYLLRDQQVSSQRQKMEELKGHCEVADAPECKSWSSLVRQGAHYMMPLPCRSPEDCIVNWISIDSTPASDVKKLERGNCAEASDATGESSNEDDDYSDNCDIDIQNSEEDPRAGKELTKHLVDDHTYQEKLQMSMPSSDCSFFPEHNASCAHVNKVAAFAQKTDVNLHEIREVHGKRKHREHDPHCTASGNMSRHNKPHKVAFCPREVRRIVELEALREKNAQSHTMRKIVVFASLGIKHGSKDMYELDFNHFSILRKGEPFVSRENPGEHVLYSNPGVQRKVFYPNRQNPTLCPVQILEEEKAMRPLDSSCPSSFFLCIKYGGTTRNLPQNEYVRQRMGRNKLKSFGPLMSKMAKLVHLRSGSFFFKALGITLLFMAGSSVHLIQGETKCRSLDLLQKHYRKDEDAKGEVLFLEQPRAFNTPSDSSLHFEQHSRKKYVTKFWHKGQTQAAKYPSSSEIPSDCRQSTSPSSPAPPQFSFVGHKTSHTQEPRADTMSTAKVSIDPYASNMLTPYWIQTPYNAFSLKQPTNGFTPMMYLLLPQPSTYGYSPPFPSSMSYFPICPHPYYSYPPSQGFIPKMVEGLEKLNAASDDVDNGSHSSSSSSYPS